MKKRTEKIHEFEAIFDPNGGGYTVTVPKLPGLVTEGSTMREAREMAKDAIRCYLEALLKDKSVASPRIRAERKERVKIIV